MTPLLDELLEVKMLRVLSFDLDENGTALDCVVSEKAATLKLGAKVLFVAAGHFFSMRTLRLVCK